MMLLNAVLVPAGFAAVLAAVLAAAAAAPALAAAPRASARAEPAACRWDDPGRSPYMGTLQAAVDSYTDIPVAVRARLKQRMATHAYDEIADIRRDSIEGQARYAPELRDMHFGPGKVCKRIDRSRWKPDHVERGLVYCDSGHCLIVPTVCRNVSRITRLGPTPSVLRERLVPLLPVEPPDTVAYVPLPSPGWGNLAPPPLVLPPIPEPGPVAQAPVPEPFGPLPVLLPMPAGPPLEMPPSPVGTPYTLPFPVLPAVPEPGTGLLFGLGLLGVATRWAWRRRAVPSKAG